MENGADEGKVLAILYKIVKSDTNKDNRLTNAADLQRIGYSGLKIETRYVTMDVP